jgi:cytochrome c oxidase subunit 2
MPASQKKRTFGWLLAALTASVSVSGCSMKSEDISGMGYPKGVSSVNDISLSLWQGSWIAAAVVGVELEIEHQRTPGS